jgi:hypothetical protein
VIHGREIVTNGGGEIVIHGRAGGIVIHGREIVTRGGAES